HAAQSLSKGSRVVVIGRLQQRSGTAADGSARSAVEVGAGGRGPSVGWGAGPREAWVPAKLGRYARRPQTPAPAPRTRPSPPSAAPKPAPGLRRRNPRRAAAPLLG